jgi:hypothetical protein
LCIALKPEPDVTGRELATIRQFEPGGFDHAALSKSHNRNGETRRYNLAGRRIIADAIVYKLRLLAEGKKLEAVRQ